MTHPHSSNVLKVIQAFESVLLMAVREDLRKSSIWKDRDKYQDKNQFSMMEDVTHWMPLPSPPQTNNNGQ